MIDTADAVRIAAVAAIALAVVGISLAWLPGVRYAGLAAQLARLLIAAGIVAVIAEPRGLGGVLGLTLTAMGLAAAWQSRPEPEVPRPRRLSIVLASAATGLVVLAALRGWWVLGGVPEPAMPVAALVLGTVLGLGTLAIADRSRIRMRDAVRQRFG